MKNKLYLDGWFDMWCLEGRRIVWREKFANGIVNTALNDILAVYLGGGAQKINWYLGLIDHAGFTSLAPTDTMSVHPGWLQLTAYNEPARPQWHPSAVVNQVITNASVINFTINAVCSIKGAFIVSDPTKGGSSGQLWSSGVFPTPQQMNNPPQTLSLSYSLAAGGS
jgi:hypothetical protein